MTDLEQRVNKVLRTAEGITQENWYDYDWVWAKTNVFRLITLIKEQQAEIGRLKSGQLRLRGYNEITESHHKKVVLALTSTNHWEELTVHYAKNEFEGTSIGGYYDGGYIMGWIDLSDLPTEIEVTA